MLLAGVLSLTLVGPAASMPASTLKSAPVASYTVTSFNVLGSSHTPVGGSRAPGTTRIVWANRLLERHGVDVAGFQEMQYDQLTKFLEITEGEWAVYPGFQLRRRDTENSIGWRTDLFDLVEARTIDITYFDGNLRPMPVVLLRHKATGLTTWFANFHNPADTKLHPNQGYWRRKATATEIALAKELRGQNGPVVITGDMNSRAWYFCRMALNAPMKAARPTSYVRNGVCHPNKPRAVDWIFGSRRLSFTHYVEDRGALVAKTTDHPMIVSDMTVDGARTPSAVTPVTP